MPASKAEKGHAMNQTITRTSDIAAAFMGGRQPLAVVGVEGSGKTTLINALLDSLPDGTSVALMHDEVRDIVRHHHLAWTNIDQAEVVICGDMHEAEAADIHRLSMEARTIFTIAANPDEGEGVRMLARWTGMTTQQAHETYSYLRLRQEPNGRRIVTPEGRINDMLR